MQTVFGYQWDTHTVHCKAGVSKTPAYSRELSTKQADRRDNCDRNAKKSNKESDERGDRCPLMYAREGSGREASSVLYLLGDKLFT